VPLFTQPLVEHGEPSDPNYPHKGGGGKTTKLGKTEQALLARAKASPNGVVTIQFTTKQGKRERLAAQALVKAGKLKWLGTQRVGKKVQMRYELRSEPQHERPNPYDA